MGIQEHRSYVEAVASATQVAGEMDPKLSKEGAQDREIAAVNPVLQKLEILELQN